MINLSKDNQISGGTVPGHITELEVVGSLENEAGFPVELDLFLNDTSGRRFSINVMTLDRYEEVKQQQPDIGEDPEAPRVLVINEEVIVMDSLVELLRAPDVDIFEPYMYPVE